MLGTNKTFAMKTIVCTILNTNKTSKCHENYIVCTMFDTNKTFAMKTI